MAERRRYSYPKRCVILACVLLAIGGLIPALWGASSPSPDHPYPVFIRGLARYVSDSQRALSWGCEGGGVIFLVLAGVLTLAANRRP